MFDSHRLESRVSMYCCHCMDQLLCSEYHGPNGSKPSFLLIKLLHRDTKRPGVRTTEVGSKFMEKLLYNPKQYIRWR